MGFLSRWRKSRKVDLDERSPELGLKYKDLLVLQQMIEAGAELTKPRHALYYLYFPDQEAAQSAAATAEREGFTPQVREPLPELPESWTLVCERHNYVLDPETVRDNTDFFERLAVEHSGEYDGWEASLD